MELPIIRHLLDCFNDKLCYCHWKSNQHFSDALSGIDDLDILINRQQYRTCAEILLKLGFKRFYTPWARSYVGVEDWLGFDSETGTLVHLHLHYRLVLGEKHLKGFLLPLEGRLLAGRRFDEAYRAYMTSYYDELLLLVLRLGMKVRLRDIRKRNQVQGSSLNEFLWLKEHCPDFEERICAEEFLSERIKKCVAAIYRGEISWMSLMSLRHSVYSDLRIFARGSGVGNTVRRWYRECVRIVLELRKKKGVHSLLFLRRRPATGGTLIAFVGSDGAGKSTAIREVRNWLNRFMDVRYFYLGSGDGESSWLRRPLKMALDLALKKKLVRRASLSTHQRVDSDRKKMGMAKKLWVYTLSRERIQKLKMTARCRQRGYVVLTDRYPQSEIPGLCDGRRLSDNNGVAAKMEARAFRYAQMCPPDVVVKMIVSPEEAVRRKPDELDVETSRILTERVMSLRFSPYTKEFVVSSDQPMEQMILEIKRCIWSQV